MSAARFGSWLLAAGGVVLVPAVVLLLLYGGIGEAKPGGLLLAAAMALLGAGGAITAIVGPPLLGNPFTRTGVGILSVGLLGMAAFSFINSQMNTDPLESLPAVVAGGIGLIGIWGGAFMTIGSVLWQVLRRTPQRQG